MKNCLLNIVILVFTICFVSFHVRCDENAGSVQVSIASWQYCFGCKQAVSLYAKLASAELQKMQKMNMPRSTVLDAGKLVVNMCDNADWAKTYQPFVKYGCIKVMSENQTRILSHFKGAATVDNIMNKNDMYHRKRKICVKETKACPSSEFKRANISSSERYHHETPCPPTLFSGYVNYRTKCAACNIIATEMYTLSKSLAEGYSLQKALEDDFCNTLGTNYQPYAWLENICEEMIEDRIDDIIGVIDFHKQVAATGFAPSESLPDMMCREQYKCSKAPSEDL